MLTGFEKRLTKMQGHDVPRGAADEAINPVEWGKQLVHLACCCCLFCFLQYSYHRIVIPGPLHRNQAVFFRGVSKSIRCPAGVRGLDRAIWAGAEEFDVGCSSG